MIRISELSTLPPETIEKDWAEDKTKEMAKEIGDLVYKMKAENKNSLLVVFQGMDSAGKDGATEAVFKYCTPSTISAFSFKKPSEEEFAHDFLWRCHKQVPRKGEAKVFVRSHYEDILIQRVHNWIDDEHRDIRMEAINAFERLLEQDNNTTIIKFFLNLSFDRQEEKLQERIDDEEKNFKHNDGDWEERKHWDAYMKCYEYVLNNSTIPWHVIPVDKRWYRNYLTTKIVHQKLVELNPKFPKLNT